VTAPEAWAWLARISRPQGRKGEVFAEILTDFPEKFADRKQLWLLGPEKPSAKSAPPTGGKGNLPSAQAPRAIELKAHWLHKGGIVLHFAGIDDISAAESLAGMIVAIPQSERAPLGEDEVYTGDLIGCAVFDVAGAGEAAPVGEIEDVDRAAGPVALLIVRGAHGEVLIPFAKSFLRRIDLQAKRIEMALPAGLVDLNPPPSKLVVEPAKD
jgi:16S rRNA processing protein RimM